MRLYRKYWNLGKETVKKFLADNPVSFSAGIAFYTIFSLPAMLLISIWIAASIYDDALVRQSLLEQIQSLFGKDSAEAVRTILKASGDIGYTMWAKIVGIGTLLLSATTVFVSLQEALNHIWNAKPNPARHGMINFVTHRLLSFAMVVSLGFILLVSLVIDTAIVLFINLIKGYFSEATAYIVAGINFAVSLLIVSVVMALIYKLLPDVKIKWKDVWVGAVVTALLFMIGKYLIGLYIGNSDIASAYGGAGSLVLLLVWVYYSSSILLLGAEFTYVHANYGRPPGEKTAGGARKKRIPRKRKLEFGNLNQGARERGNHLEKPPR
ncbi:MAG TPA: YihY/virulence factor BrkB family protein [Gammaproteobacteria bacterium]|nr:YihY/virulence factor BrkB family protein [Gammaproteobacteria bacterium]